MIHADAWSCRRPPDGDSPGLRQEAGVGILAGTDTLNPYCFPGFSLHDELALLVECGLSPRDALLTATRNPAVYLGREKDLGTVETGKLADLVLWKPAMFGAKPEMVVKGGVIAWAQMGDPNASIPTPQPVFMRPMFGAFGRATGMTSIAFVSQLAKKANVGKTYGLTKRVEAVKGCRKVGKKELKWNNAMPKITVDPETYEVRADGELLTCQPAKVLPLAQRYNLF